MADKVTVPVSLHSHASSVPTLIGSNYSEWSEHVQFTLGVLDLDLAILEEKPVAITEDSTEEQVAYFDLWKRSNRLSLMFMKLTIANNIRTSLPQALPQDISAKEYLKAVEDRFKSADKSLAGTLMAELTSMKYDGSRGIQEHILDMTDKENDFKCLKEGRANEYWPYIPLVKAALKGDWNAANKIFDADKDAINARINCSSETALFIAIGAGKSATHFVKELVKLMSKDDLKLRDKNNNTALHTAAMVGNKKAAVHLVRKNPDLLMIRGELGLLPMHVAAINADVALKLLKRYPQAANSKPEDHDFVLEWIATKASAFRSGSHLNFGQRILYYFAPAKRLETNPTNNPSSGDLEDQTSEWIEQKCCDRIIWAQRLKKYSNYGWQILKSVPWKVCELVPFIKLKHIREQKEMHREAVTLLRFICQKMGSLNDSNTSRLSAYEAAYKAASSALSLGIHEVIEEIAHSFPYIIWMRDANNLTLFQRAVIDRHENVFNLLYQLGDNKRYATNVEDNHQNTMLHLAARLAPAKKLDRVPGPALQMQHELQWYKGVEKLAKPRHIYQKNKDGKTPEMIFTEAHKELVVEGRKWMKNTATSCTITAALIVTVVFAAGIVVPGGNDPSTGLPIFSKKMAFSKEIAFLVFAVSNALALFTSTTSLLMFLSILTSRYAESDFLHVLPKRLIIGLITLFLSITTMIVAFSATLYLAFGHHKNWILIPVAVFACLPVTSFVSHQFSLLGDLISSTFGQGVLGKQSDRLIC